MKRIACALFALCMAACGQAVDNKPPETSDNHQTKSAEPEFAFDAQQFADAFNNAARTYGQSFRIAKVDVTHGAVHDYFRQVFFTGLSLTAGVSKETGHVVSITALAEENGEPMNREEIIVLSEIVATATNPALTKEKAAKLVGEMMQESDGRNAAPFPQRFIDDVRYVLRNDSGIGYWWMASPA